MGQKLADESISAISIKDDIGEDFAKETIDHLKKEIDLFKRNLEDNKKSKENFTVQWDVDNEVYQRMIKGIKKINPDFEYEQDDAFWELRRKQLEYKYRMDKHMAESKINEFDRMEQAIAEQLKSSEDKLKDMEGGQDGQ
jgi:hypothetical protein